eukprot:scaffold321357_cov48-Tisochrysis_lutea.AAC.3
MEHELSAMVGSLKEQLDAQGVLSTIRAQLRAHVYGVLNGTTAPQAIMSSQRCTALALGLIEELLVFNGCERALDAVADEISGWSSRVKPQDLASALRMADGSVGAKQPLLATLIQAYHGLMEKSVPSGVTRESEKIMIPTATEAAPQTSAAADCQVAERAAAKTKMEEEGRAKGETAKREAAERAQAEEEDKAKKQAILAQEPRDEEEKAQQKMQQNKSEASAREAAEQQKGARRATEREAAQRVEAEKRMVEEVRQEEEDEKFAMEKARQKLETQRQREECVAGEAQPATEEQRETEKRFIAAEKARKEAQEAFNGSTSGGGGSLLGELPPLGGSCARGGGSLLGDLPGLGRVRGLPARRSDSVQSTKKKVSFAPEEAARRDAGGEEDEVESFEDFEHDTSGAGGEGSASVTAIRGLHAGLAESQATRVGKGVMDAFMRSVQEKEDAVRAKAEEEKLAKQEEERKAREAKEAAEAEERAATEREAAEREAEERLQREATADVPKSFEDGDSSGSSEEDLINTLEALSDDSDGEGAWGTKPQEGMAPGRRGQGGQGGPGGPASKDARAKPKVLLEALSDSEDDGGIGWGTDGGRMSRESGCRPTLNPSLAWREEGYLPASDPQPRPVLKWGDEDPPKTSKSPIDSSQLGNLASISRCALALPDAMHRGVETP